MLQAMPLTPSGKLDRLALPAPEGDAYANRSYEAPQGEAEEALAGIWQELLRIERVGRHDNFFDLGGHSLAAAQMIGQLNQLGVNLPLMAIFQHGTIKQLADIVSRQSRSGPAKSDNLVAIRSSGSRTPLFLIHEVSGQVLPYIALAGLLEEDQPVYGIQATHVDEEAAMDIEQMAQSYLGAIRQVQPHGPYQLAGWSAGGLVAYEMASLLLGEDEAVQFVGMIDTYHPALDIDGTERGDTEVLLAFLQSHYDIAEGTLRSLRDAVEVETFVHEARKAGLLPPDVQLAEVQRYIQMYRCQTAALQRYRPQPTTTPVHLFTAEHQPGEDPKRGWGNLLGSLLQQHPIGGTHHSIVVGPHVVDLARGITVALMTAPIPPKQPHQPLVSIQLGPSASPVVVCVPGAGAGVTGFSSLTMALGKVVTVYGTQPRGLDEDWVPHRSVEAAARSYLRALKEVQPIGPYRLVGHSFGGWVAFEMAYQIEAMGEQVQSVAMLDSCDPRQPDPCGLPLHGPLDSVLELVEIMEQGAQRSLGLTMQALADLDHEQRVQALHRSMVREKLLPERAGVDVVRRVLRVFTCNLNTSYTPAGSISAPLLFVRPHDAIPDRKTGFPHMAGWSAHAPLTTVVTVPGNHMSMLDMPNVQAIADQLHDMWKQ
jgi:thioesterase domain-containing protein